VPLNSQVDSQAHTLTDGLDLQNPSELNRWSIRLMCPVKRWAIQGDRSWILPAPDEHELLEIPVPSPHTFGLDDYFFRESEVLPGVLRLSSLLP